MTPEPKISPEPPYRWVGCIVLHPPDIRELLDALPWDLHLSNQLRDTAQVAETLALRLNEINESGVAP